jgi:hypothetical protein
VSSTPIVLGSSETRVQAQAEKGTSLPFSGSYSGGSHSTFQPPITLLLDGTGNGTATHLGAFTLVQVDVVDTTQSKSTGTFTLTAANGDRLSAETSGGEVGFTPPNISEVILSATIVGGTGRFTNASGTFSIHTTQVIDFAAGTAVYTGSFDGHIDLNK